jgi:hypothetical protein
MGIEMFCNFIDDSIKEAHFLEPIYGDDKSNTASQNAPFLKICHTLQHSS